MSQSFVGQQLLLILVIFNTTIGGRGQRGHNRMVVGFPCEVYNIMFVSDLRQFGGFLLVFRFPLPIKLAPSLQYGN